MSKRDKQAVVKLLDTAADILKATGWCKGKEGEVNIETPDGDGVHCALGALAGASHITEKAGRLHFGAGGRTGRSRVYAKGPKKNIPQHYARAVILTAEAIVSSRKGQQFLRSGYAWGSDRYRMNPDSVREAAQIVYQFNDWELTTKRDVLAAYRKAARNLRKELDA